MSLVFQSGPAGNPRADEPPPRLPPRYYSLKGSMNLCMYYTTTGPLVKYPEKKIFHPGTPLPPGRSRSRGFRPGGRFCIDTALFSMVR